MKNSFLMQTEIVERLLNINSQILPTLPESELKQALVDAMKNFKIAITPSAIFLSEIYDNLTDHSINLNREEATRLLNTAAQDIDLNYASNAVAYHTDQYISDIT